MKKIAKCIITLGTITSITIFSSIISMASTEIGLFDNTNTETGTELKAAASKHVKQTGTKSKSTSYGTASVTYKFSGNYTYDLNSGEILSAYGAQLDNFTFNPPPASNEAPNPDFWTFEALDTRVTASVIDKGARAKYTVSFILKAMYLEGGAIGTSKTISIPVTDTLYAYAE